MRQDAARDLVPHLREQFWRVFGEQPTAAEVRNWERSIPALLRQLTDAGLHDVGVLVDYRLPLTSKRANVVLLGRHPRGGPSCVVVENKQWSRVKLADAEYRLVAASGPGEQERLHPQEEVRRYAEYLEDFNRFLGEHPGSVTGCVFLHNATSGTIAELRHPDLADLAAYPAFAGDEMAALRSFLTQRLAPVSGAQIADDVLQSVIAPSKQLLRLVREEITANSQYKLLDEEKVACQPRLIAIQTDDTVRILDSHSQDHTLLYIASLEAHGWKSVIEELEEMINSATVTESRLQDFFERNPQFLCGDSYEAAQPHIVLQRPSAGPLIPDFALKPSNEHALCDLLDLKLPRAKLVVGQSNRRRLSAVLLEACAQLREYRDYFEVQENRDAIEEMYGLRFYRPKMIAVIGKRSDYSANDLRKAESDIPQLIITTYDDLLDRARSRIRAAKLRKRANPP
jgi:hypothetical protein